MKRSFKMTFHPLCSGGVRREGSSSGVELPPHIIKRGYDAS